MARKAQIPPRARMIREIDDISARDPGIPNLRGSLARIPESRFYRAPPAGAMADPGVSDRELQAWLFRARHEARRRGLLEPNRARSLPPRPGRRPLPRPTRQPAAVLSSVRTIVHREERAPFDPERRYARETKPHHFAVNRRRLRRNSDSVTRDLIVEGAASSFFVSAWADGAEEAGHSFAGGTQLDKVAPPVPRELERFAEKFIRSVEKLNRQSITDLYMEHAVASGHHEDEPSPAGFGSDLALESLGTGVSWYDDHPRPESGEVVLPDTEVIVDVDPDDIDDATVNYAELSERLAR